MDGSDQISSAVMLGAVLAVGLALFFLLIWLVRGVWRWMTGGGQQTRSAQDQEPKFDSAKPINGSAVSASDLFVVRSNLNAVARQLEDLERKLRLEPSGHAEMASSRD
jgi:hypothetical protein